MPDYQRHWIFRFNRDIIFSEVCIINSQQTCIPQFIHFTLLLIHFSINILPLHNKALCCITCQITAELHGNVSDDYSLPLFFWSLCDSKCTIQRPMLWRRYFNIWLTSVFTVVSTSVVTNNQHSVPAGFHQPDRTWQILPDTWLLLSEQLITSKTWNNITDLCNPRRHVTPAQIQKGFVCSNPTKLLMASGRCCLGVLCRRFFTYISRTHSASPTKEKSKHHRPFERRLHRVSRPSEPNNKMNHDALWFFSLNSTHTQSSGRIIYIIWGGINELKYIK